MSNEKNTFVCVFKLCVDNLVINFRTWGIVPNSNNINYHQKEKHVHISLLLPGYKYNW